ncbi:hypothetical protein EC919_104235 [Pseudomonas graminis]|nr:hypothetical protein EC919_104235 [Pseudomonas graminis]
MLQAEFFIHEIQTASSLETAELDTLRAGAHLTQALAGRLISREEFDLLSRAVGESLRDWRPPSVDEHAPHQGDLP